MNKFFQLLISFSHKEKFEWKSVLLRILVKTCQEGIVCKLFQYQARIKMPRQHMRQGCFSRADISFYGDEVVIHLGRT
jgi:hypothetical protein